VTRTGGQAFKRAGAAIATLSWVLSLIPDLPGKLRLGRILLRPFLSRAPAVLKDRAGCTYVLPSYAETMAQHIFTFGAVEPHTQDAILKFLPKKGTFIDVGANIGTLTIPIAKARPHASIISLEADPNVYGLLQENVTRNGCALVQLVSCVAAATDGQLVRFYPAPAHKFCMGSIGPQFSDIPTMMLNQRSLDAILASMDVQKVDVVKIDVEGAELGVLRGAKRLLDSKCPPVIVFEFIDWAEARIPNQQPGDAQAFLLAEGYRLFCLKRGGRLGQQLTQPLREGFAMLIALPPQSRGSA
jgi:FkbM family methyltransferase